MKQFRQSALSIAAILALMLSNYATVDAAGTPIEINAILPMTGVGAFYGKSQAETFGVVESVVNASGGVNGRPIKFVISDDQTNPQNALTLANQIITKNVPVIMGPSYTANCLSIAPVVAANGPVLYCLTPGIHPKRGGYVFTIANTFYDTANATIRYFHKRGWSRIGLLTTIDAGGQEAERAFTAGAERAKMQIVASAHFNPSDVSASAQIAHIAAAKPDVFIAWAVGTPLGTVLRNMHDGGLDVPTVTSPANLSYVQMKQYSSFLPSELFFPGYRPVTESGTRPGPLHDKLAVFFAAMKKAGLPHDLVHSLNWDAAMLVVDALRHSGPNPTAASIRDYIMNLHGWAGILAMYDFGDPEQRGIGENAIIMDRWDPAKADFVPISGAGGS
jgi:branched-chain amino acid transport system substrate-binding protein